MNTFVPCFGYDIRQALVSLGPFSTVELFGLLSFIRSV